MPLGNRLSGLRTPLQTQRSGVAARFNTEQKHHLPFSRRFFIVYCAALWRLCAGGSIFILLGVAQLIELAQLLADRVHAGAALTSAASSG
ncbi:hypothetical protein [Pseudomonas synxantha]|uniref:hypothetical protein n=1 Tax=Pseudomonas synxantha TaxID=47883 RepID=UPI000F573A61